MDETKFQPNDRLCVFYKLDGKQNAVAGRVLDCTLDQVRIEAVYSTDNQVGPGESCWFDLERYKFYKMERV